MKLKDDAYFKELERVLHKDEIESAFRGSGRFVVLMGESEVCRVAPSGEVLLNPGYTFSKEVNALYHRVTVLADRVQEYMQGYEQGPVFNQS